MLKYLNELKEEIISFKQVQDTDKFIRMVPVLENILRHMSANGLKKAFQEMEFIFLDKG